jgi:putative membrane protein
MQLAILLGLVVVIGAVAFALQNSVPVTVVFLIWRFDSSLPIVLLLSVAAGALVIALLSTPSVLRLQWTVARQRRRINELELANGELKARVQQLAPADSPPEDRGESGLARMAPRLP